MENPLATAKTSKDTCKVYRRLSLWELLDLIVVTSDRDALDEVHEHRMCFRNGSTQPMRFIEYVHYLQREHLSATGNPSQRFLDIVQAATDLCVDKYVNLPNGRSTKGPDCRNYFRAVLKVWRCKESERLSCVQREEELGHFWKALVGKSFAFSLIEAKRAIDKSVSRYRWECQPGKMVSLWFPADVAGNDRKRWLEFNVPTDMLKGSEIKENVQSLIDEKLGHLRTISFDELECCADESLWSQPEVAALLAGVEVDDLANSVADEKARTIRHQRGPIRKLGSMKLRNLVRTIFDNLDGDELTDTRIAAKFGLSKATFSRFGGSQWERAADRDTEIPALWRNCAQVVACNRALREAAEDAGVWDVVSRASISFGKE